MNPTRQQQRFLEAIAPPGAKVTVRAGHGVGKSGATSGAIWWHLECFDYCKIPCTAPTASQLHNVLWAEIAKWQRLSDEQSAITGMPKFLWLSSLFNISEDRIADPSARQEWYALARTSRRENPDALQGFHASDLLITEDDKAVNRSESSGSIMFVIEEASGVPDEIFEVAEGALSSPDSRLILVGNPTRNTGFFARSHGKDRASYTTLHFSCSDSPLVADNYRPNLVKKYGEGSNIVRVRADGEFPKQDDDVLISIEIAESAIDREPIRTAGVRKLGVDVARYGNDRTVFLLRCDDVIERIEIRSKQDTMATTGQAVALANEMRADEIYVDEIGVGAGVLDRLKELRSQGQITQTIVGVDVARASPTRKATPDNADNPEGVEAQGWKLRDHLWMEARNWLMTGRPAFACERGHAEDLAGELASPLYKHDSSGHIVVESKDAMKERLKPHGRSPDIAEALIVTFAPVKQFGLVF